MNILWMSNAPWGGTGYGVQTELFVKRLKKMGHNVALLPYWGYDGQKDKINGLTVYGKGVSAWGDDIIPIAVIDHKADIVISLMDVFVLDIDNLKRNGIRYCPWLPVDHYPAPRNTTDRLRDAYRPIAMSRFGERALREQGVWADYIPHGVDTNVFYPTKRLGKQYKRMLGFPDDCFLVTMVAANKGFPCRKAFPEAFEAFADFNKRVPNARLYVHTIPDERWGGPDLRQLAVDMGINPMHMRTPTPERFMLGFTQSDLRQVYNAADVLLNPSYGEGFGVPIIEAQACGTPVIVTDFSAMPEVAGVGWHVNVARRWWTPMRSFQALPDIADIVNALEQSYETWTNKKWRTERSQEAREFVVENYDADHVADTYWREYLEIIESELGVYHLENPGSIQKMDQAKELPGVSVPGLEAVLSNSPD